MAGRRGTSARRSIRSLIGAFIAVVAIVGGGLIAPLAAPQAEAADLSQFQAGNIVNDAVFFNSNAMSQAQIQSFLQSKEANCAPSATCVKDYYTTTTSIGADAMCSAYSGGGSERASAIIYKVARACGINPQALIVIMQKEQGLITSVWPSAGAYKYAMGADCPDTTGCNGVSAGFFAQVYKGAWQLKRYGNPPGTSNYFNWYPVGQTSNILYNPNSACGRKAVYVQNKATAALYYYTPYTPNAAAIAAGYGSGDSCSSYGNRNFYNYFTDWFGSTQGGPAALPGPVYASLDRPGYVLGLNVNGALSAYPISSNGIWGSPVVIATGIGGSKAVLSLGDLDGDGRNDVIAVSPSGAVQLLRGGSGTALRSPQTLGVSWAGARLIAAAGDANGDGIPDAYTIGADNQLLLWPGTRWGGFGNARVIPGDWGAVDMVTGGMDLSGDSIPDLVARTASGDLYLYAGDGHGGFAGSRLIGTGWTGMAAIVSPGDVTGDSQADILAEDATGALRLYNNIGGGALAGGAQIGSGWQIMTALSGATAAPQGARVKPAGVGDLNGDLAPDVLAVSASGKLLLYPGNGAGGWGAPTVAVSSWGRATLVPLGDFNGDGYPDVGAVGSDGSLLLYRGNGAGGFLPPVWIGGGWSGLTVIGGVDYDGDGNVDVIARSAAGQLLLYRGNGIGGWANAQGQGIGTYWNTFDTVFSIGDFDGNHRPALAARRTDGTLWLYPMTGQGGWGSPRVIGTAWNGIPSVFSPGDFDGSGGPDVMARMPNGDLRLYRGDGHGGWAGVSVIGTGWGNMLQVD